MEILKLSLMTLLIIIFPTTVSTVFLFQSANWFGSITQASTMCLGTDGRGSDVYIPFHSILPMVNPDDIVFDGWDISSMNLADCMERAKVLDWGLQVSAIFTNCKVYRFHLIACVGQKIGIDR